MLVHACQYACGVHNTGLFTVMVKSLLNLLRHAITVLLPMSSGDIFISHTPPLE